MASIHDSMGVAAAQRERDARAGGPEAGDGLSKAGLAFVILAGLLVAAVVIQIFIAGVAVFADGTRWETHRSFVHTFEFLPLVMLVLALAARLGRRLAILSGVLLVLIMAQYTLVELRTTDVAELAALHVVNAVAIYYASVQALRGGMKALRRRAAS